MSLHRALAENQIVLHYQPQVEVLTGKVIGVEALVRWEHPVLGLMYPGEFIPDAEAAGLIGPLTARVLDLALEQAAAWAADDWPMKVAVNLSAVDLADETLPDTVVATLARHGLAATSLELEVTETAALDDPLLAIDSLTALDALGIDIAVDDYGAGYSTLAYLKRLPARRLKLDRSLITDLAREHADQMIVRSTLQLARELGLGVVAEGVENTATLRLLRDLGCDTAQGFGLGRPMSSARVRQSAPVLEERLAGVLAA